MGNCKIPVFISYSHDSDAHRERVLALSERLRADGVDTILDRYVDGTPQQGWPRWMLDQIDAASFVLVVCTKTYYRRFRGQEEPGKGKGVDWEGALITQEIYDSRSRTVKFVPVFLEAAVLDWIPEPVRSHTHYVLTSEPAYQSLYDFLLDQAGVEPGPVGALQSKPRRTAAPLVFEETPGAEAERFRISRIDRYAPGELIGRAAETKLLVAAWDRALRGATPRTHILTFVALGGEGKTSLVAKWAAEMAGQGWPGCEAAFAWSFYSQGTREQVAASSDLFLKEALSFFGDEALAGSAQGGLDKGRRLAELVGKKRALLILDGLEPLQHAPNSPTPGELKDQGVAALLKGLAASSRGLCVVTTRYSIPDLKAYWQTTASETKLTRLEKGAGVALLRVLGVKGTKKELESLVEDVKGHALTVSLFGAYLRDAHGGDIRKRDLVNLEEADVEEHGGHAFRAMHAYEQWLDNAGENGRRALALLRLLGLFDRPATAGCLRALLEPPAIAGLTESFVGRSEAERNVVLSRLEAAKLLTVHRDPAGALVSLDAHPLLREFFARQLRTEQPEAWRGAHRRLYEYLCTNTPDLPRPTLEDLEPLYQAVAHGCQASKKQETLEIVYRARILRGDEHYPWHQLAAFGAELEAQAWLFESCWDRISTDLREEDQAWLLHECAFCLHVLGRPTEALLPMRTALNMRVKHGDLRKAAITANNLSALELTLGDLCGSLETSKHAVLYAERCGDPFQTMVNRSMLADALHQAGHRAEADHLLHEAELIQVRMQPGLPVLYSIGSFRFCDLLLAADERTAWQRTLLLTQSTQAPALCHSCDAVVQRAARTLEIAERNRWLLDVALDYLTLARAALYHAILEGSNLEHCRSSLQHAVDRLRRAGAQEFILRGLLTRAWFCALRGSSTGPESAQEDLNEAREIAERGPMPLFLADIYLHRARLFRSRAALVEARKLIEKHGYWRRKEELEDAEVAAKYW